MAFEGKIQFPRGCRLKFTKKSSGGSAKWLQLNKCKIKIIAKLIDFFSIPANIKIYLKRNQHKISSKSCISDLFRQDVSCQTLKDLHLSQLAFLIFCTSSFVQHFFPAIVQILIFSIITGILNVKANSFNSGCERQIGAFGFREIVIEFYFSFNYFLFLSNSFFCFCLQSIHTEVFISREHSFYWKDKSM